MPAMDSRLSPLIMGILNVTPDSFSDGGCFLDPEAAIRRAEQLVEEGADLIDVGGESTRPGAEEVPAAVERTRVIPVIKAIAARFPVRISVDTRKAEVAEEALAGGASVINDVSGGSDGRMLALAAAPGIDIILMHMQGSPATMQQAPAYPRGVVTEVAEFLGARVRSAGEQGVPPERVWVDPGIGFGKTVEQNVELLRGLARLVPIGTRLVVGTSRKSFLAKLAPGEDRLSGTIATNLWGLSQGASVFRVHDVAAFRRALVTWRALAETR
jgi:dihydropteroate synthase